MKIKFAVLMLSVLLMNLSSCGSSDDEQFIPPPPIDNSEEEKEEEEGDENSDVTTTIDGFKYGSNFIVFEPEVTKSSLGLWKKRVPADAEYHVGDMEAINKGYMEFTGNNMNGGAANSPLEYTFTAPETAKYRLAMRMYQPLADGELGDKRNDVWVKLAGDFTTACVYPTEELKKNHKFWGRGVRKWGSMHKLEGHVDGVKKMNFVHYNLKKDESYTLTISGRAQGCSIDYILLYDDSANYKIDIHDDPAVKLPAKFLPDVIE
jgi:hypothetical protein